MQESKVKWLFRIVYDFDAIHTSHPRNGYKSELDLALGVGSNRGKGPVYGPAFSAGHDMKELTARRADAGRTSHVCTTGPAQHPDDICGSGHNRKLKVIN